MSQISLKFEPEKETKNTVRFQEKIENIKGVGPLYIQKEFIEKNFPHNKPSNFTIIFKFDEETKNEEINNNN